MKINKLLKDKLLNKPFPYKWTIIVPATSYIYDKNIYDPTMMLLIGMWISLTKNPMNPIMQKPIAVAMAIF